MRNTGAAIQKYGPQGGFVEMGEERCIIRAGDCTFGGCSAMQISIRAQFCLRVWQMTGADTFDV